MTRHTDLPALRSRATADVAGTSGRPASACGSAASSFATRSCGQNATDRATLRYPPQSVPAVAYLSVVAVLAVIVAATFVLPRLGVTALLLGAPPLVAVWAARRLSYVTDFYPCRACGGTGTIEQFDRAGSVPCTCAAR